MTGNDSVKINFIYARFILKLNFDFVILMSSDDSYFAMFIMGPRRVKNDCTLTLKLKFQNIWLIKSFIYIIIKN